LLKALHELQDYGLIEFPGSFFVHLLNG